MPVLEPVFWSVSPKLDGSRPYPPQLLSLKVQLEQLDAREQQLDEPITSYPPCRHKDTLQKVRAKSPRDQRRLGCLLADRPSRSRGLSAVCPCGDRAGTKLLCSGVSLNFLQFGCPDIEPTSTTAALQLN